MIEARPTKTSKYERSTDQLFGRVESFNLVHEHRVQVQIGSSFFTSNRTYPSASAARRRRKG